MLAVYALTITLSALLLFLVQPMFAKMVLPSLGGSPSVWNTCMVFFQAALLLGYAYAHLGARLLSAPRQAALHVALLALSLAALPIWPRYVDPTGAAPIPWLIGLLAVSLGIPFVMLAASAPMLQRWFAESRHTLARDPYFLYSASNIGSIAALVAYPLLVEPQLTLRQQSHGWSAGYGLLAVLVAACAWLLYRSGTRGAAPVADGTYEREAASRPVTHLRRAHWVLLAFAPSSLLLGLTTYITTDIAAVPLLWVVPLLLYLLTFVIVFARRPPLPPGWMVSLQPFVLIAVVLLLFAGQSTSLWVMAPLHILLFFASAMICHGVLAGDRPSTRHLTEFYLWMAFGGVLGGMFNALLAPVIFNQVLEYPIAIALACMLRPHLSDSGRWSRWLDLALPFGVYIAIRALGHVGTLLGPELALPLAVAIAVASASLLFAWRLRPVRFGLLVAVLLLYATMSSGESKLVLSAERSFFGVYKVLESTNGAVRVMMHGTTLHGTQATERNQAKLPLSYFHREGPFGQVFAALDNYLAGKRIGVVGLGVGTLACYGKPAQQMTFFEIDPLVVRLATNPALFTYLRDCGAFQPEVVIGDGRLMLEREPDGTFALLVLDAFSSDSIPVHLLTREALQLYFRKLEPDGVVALQITNRYLDLAPVIAAMAGESGLVGRVSVAPDRRQQREWAQGFSLSPTLVVLARKEADLRSLADSPRWQPLSPRDGITGWTDDYSNILDALMYGRARPAGTDTIAQQLQR